jgi:hypothetical protein
MVIRAHHTCKTQGDLTSPSETMREKQTFRCHSYLQISRQKLIKSKINKYKINNNNKTNTKHELIVKYEGY